jgi:hypothetical protein
MKIGGLTWNNVKDVFPNCHNMSSLLLTYPKAIALNFMTNLSMSWHELTVPLAASLVCIYGCVRGEALTDRRRRFGIATIFVVSAANVVLLSLAFVSDRHLMLSSSLLTCCGAAALTDIVVRRGRFGSVPALGFLVALVSLWALAVNARHTLEQARAFTKESARTDKTVQTRDILMSLGCGYLETSQTDRIDTILIGDDFIDPSSSGAIGQQPWRKDFQPFRNIVETRAWMAENGYKCIVFDERSLEGRIPGMDSASFKNEYENGLLFRSRIKTASYDTYVFKID